MDRLDIMFLQVGPALPWYGAAVVAAVVGFLADLSSDKKSGSVIVSLSFLGIGGGFAGGTIALLLEWISNMP